MATDDPSAPTFSLDELATAAGIPRRTVRYYIEIGLIDKAEGETRAAKYSVHHLEQLIAVRRWTEQGISLSRIKDLLARGDKPPPAPERQPGAIAVRTHVVVAEGIELVIDPSRAGLDPQQLRNFIRLIAQAYEAAGKDKE